MISVELQAEFPVLDLFTSLCPVHACPCVFPRCRCPQVRKVLDNGLKVILCIGESKEEYEAGLNKEVNFIVKYFMSFGLPSMFAVLAFHHRRCSRARGHVAALVFHS